MKSTLNELNGQAQGIRDELKQGANTKTRIYTMFKNILDSFVHADKFILSLPIYNDLSSTVNTSKVILGELNEQANDQESLNYNTPFSLGGGYLYLNLTELTGIGDVTITGTSINALSKSPIEDDTEVIVIDAIANYKSSKKWLYVSSMVFSVGVESVTYSFGQLGYFRGNNRNFYVKSLDWSIKAVTGLDPDIRIQMIKVNDLGNKKYSLTYLEDMGFISTDGSGSYVDHVRTGLSDRSYDMPITLAPDEIHIVFSEDDYKGFYTTNETLINGAYNEGIIIRLTGEGDSGLSNIANAFLNLGFIV